MERCAWEIHNVMQELQKLHMLAGHGDDGVANDNQQPHAARRALRHCDRILQQLQVAVDQQEDETETDLHESETTSVPEDGGGGGVVVLPGSLAEDLWTLFVSLRARFVDSQLQDLAACVRQRIAPLLPPHDDNHHDDDHHHHQYVLLERILQHVVVQSDASSFRDRLVGAAPWLWVLNSHWIESSSTEGDAMTFVFAGLGFADAELLLQVALQTLEASRWEVPPQQNSADDGDGDLFPETCLQWRILAVRILQQYLQQMETSSAATSLVDWLVVQQQQERGGTFVSTTTRQPKSHQVQAAKAFVRGLDQLVTELVHYAVDALDGAALVLVDNTHPALWTTAVQDCLRHVTLATSALPLATVGKKGHTRESKAASVLSKALATAFLDPPPSCSTTQDDFSHAWRELQESVGQALERLAEQYPPPCWRTMALTVARSSRGTRCGDTQDSTKLLQASVNNKQDDEWQQQVRHALAVASLLAAAETTSTHPQPQLRLLPCQPDSADPWEAYLARKQAALAV